MSAPTRVVSTVGPVLIIGSGLLGASLGLALRAGGVRVYLEDASPTSLRLASDVGAGVAFGDAIDEAGGGLRGCGNGCARLRGSAHRRGGYAS